jgi:hypothetical protein
MFVYKFHTIFCVYCKFCVECVPFAVDRHLSRGIHRTHGSQVVVAGLNPERLQVGGARPLQSEAHRDDLGVVFVGFVGDYS